ncbi:hypothetical protein BB558_003843 [Smittium angustum]|uniref:DNA mismatch repair protein MutS core domain-containing protein n=1 Tax=Smittium angustum TaxID=133377 RepID=A0A2U1J4V2_SMIAN|nr:hypothetical protein BB558_003843 [Smittium angustum]
MNSSNFGSPNKSLTKQAKLSQTLFATNPENTHHPGDKNSMSFASQTNSSGLYSLQDSFVPAKTKSFAYLQSQKRKKHFHTQKSSTHQTETKSLDFDLNKQNLNPCSIDFPNKDFKPAYSIDLTSESDEDHMYVCQNISHNTNNYTADGISIKFEPDTCPSTTNNTYEDMPLNDIYSRSKYLPSSSGKSTISTNINNIRNTRIIVAIVEGAGIASEIGLCALNLDLRECYLSQYADYGGFSKTIYNIELYNPGISAIKNWISEQDEPNIIMALNSRFYCLSALGALFSFLEDQSILEIKKKSVVATYQDHNCTMYIDSNTSKDLDLIESASGSDTQSTLFSVMNNTLTYMGRRMLRLNMLQPSTDPTTINGRLDAIEELLSTDVLFFGLKTELKDFPDIDATITAVY